MKKMLSSLNWLFQIEFKVNRTHWLILNWITVAIRKPNTTKGQKLNVYLLWLPPYHQDMTLTSTQVDSFAYRFACLFLQRHVLQLVFVYHQRDFMLYVVCRVFICSSLSWVHLHNSKIPKVSLFFSKINFNLCPHHHQQQ